MQKLGTLYVLVFHVQITVEFFFFSCIGLESKNVPFLQKYNGAKI